MMELNINRLKIFDEVEAKELEVILDGIDDFQEALELIMFRRELKRGRDALTGTSIVD